MKLNWIENMKAYQHILLTTDFSNFSEEVAKKAVNLAGHYNANITLLHVVEHSREDIPLDLHVPEGADPTEYVIAQNRRRLEKFIQSIPNFKVIPMVSLLLKTVEDEIINVALKIKADLIIIGANGQNGVSVLPRLDVKTIKTNAPCDVLVVHAVAA